VDCERTTDQLFKSNLTFCVVCVFARQTGDSSMPTLRIIKNEHPIEGIGILQKKKKME
jgi:hypothetical protein